MTYPKPCLFFVNGQGLNKYLPNIIVIQSQVVDATY